MGGKWKLFIVEDHQLFREGLKAMLSQEDDWEVIGEAADGLEAIRLIQADQAGSRPFGSFNASHERVFGAAGNQTPHACDQGAGLEHS